MKFIISLILFFATPFVTSNILSSFDAFASDYSIVIEDEEPADEGTDEEGTEEGDEAEESDTAPETSMLIQDEEPTEEPTDEGEGTEDEVTEE